MSNSYPFRIASVQWLASWAFIGTLMLASSAVAQSTAGDSPRADAEKGAYAAKQSPQLDRKLYLHWYRPVSRSGAPPKLLLSLLVRPSVPIDVAFHDPNFPTRKCSLRGRIDLQDGKHIGKFDVIWKSGEAFEGKFQVDKPRRGRVTGFASAYWPTGMLLTTHRSSERALQIVSAASRRSAVDTDQQRLRKKSDLVAMLKVQRITRRTEIGETFIEKGKCWYVIRADVVSVLSGGLPNDGDVIEVVMQSEENASVLGFVRHPKSIKADRSSEWLVRPARADGKADERPVEFLAFLKSITPPDRNDIDVPRYAPTSGLTKANESFKLLGQANTLDQPSP